MIEKYKQQKKQARRWIKHARILPMVALSILIVPYIVGWTSITDKIVCAIIIGFFTAAVLWWYWAVEKIILLLSVYENNDQFADSVANELLSIRKVIKEIKKLSSNDK